MKLKFLNLVLLFSISLTYSTEVVLTSGNQQTVLDTINFLNGEGGTIVINGDININSNISIPKSVSLKFIYPHKLIIKENVTLTIDGLIESAPYQIFELKDNGTIDDCPFDKFDLTLDDGKVRGNLQNEYVIPQWWGVDDEGTVAVSQLFQKAIESFPNVKKFVANGTFLLDLTLWLNQDNTYYDFSGSTFIGVNQVRTTCKVLENEYPQHYTSAEIEDLPKDWPATDDGGLINIGKQRDLTETTPYSAQNITLFGGHYIPKNEYDNALGIVNAKNIKILNVNIDCTNGFRGIAIQHPKFWNLETITENVIIKDIVQNGGVNVFNIDMEEGRPHSTKNVVVSNVIGNNIENIHPKTNEKEAAFRISSGEDMLKIENLDISNVVLNDVYQGFELRGVKANVSNVQIHNIEHIGINIQFPDILNLSDIRITGNSNTTDGIVGVGPSTSLSNEVSFDNVKLNGTFKHAIWNSIKNTKFNRLFVNGEFMYGIYNNAENCSYKSISISSSISKVDYTAIDNTISAPGSNFSGTIQGKYEYGIINASKNCIMDFKINGSFSNAAILSNGSSSIYNAYINLSDLSKPINSYRTDDIYKLYVFDQTENIYKLNPTL